MKVHCLYAARSVLGESALWSPDEKALYWVDQIRPEFHRFDPETGEDTLIAVDLPVQLGAVVPRAEGGLVLVASDGVSLLGPDLGTRALLTNPIASLPRACFNDGKCDRQGRLWAGTTDRAEEEEIGCLYRIDADGTSKAFASGFVCSNGPSFSPDGKIMYHTRSHERSINAYSIDTDSGDAYNPKVFAIVDPEAGVPDGSTVDAEGCLWSTHWGGWRITRYTPQGRIDRVIEMPVKSPTSCAFGGSDLRTLFVTSASAEFSDGRWCALDERGFAEMPMAGGIFAVDVGVGGLPEPKFLG
jgi:sugar lactone lactonase YvrE